NTYYTLFGIHPKVDKRRLRTREYHLFLGGKVLLLMRIMQMMMIPEPKFNLQITMRVSLANQVYQEDQHQVPSIFSQALRIKR
ncbi:hypothetical protein HID58_006963, partial [Brassica napus]